MSVTAMPVWVGPYGAGAWAKSSCQVSALAGRITIVSDGTTTTWLLTVSVPPWWAPTPGPVPGPPSVAACRKPVMSNWVLVGGTKAANDVPAAGGVGTAPACTDPAGPRTSDETSSDAS